MTVPATAEWSQRPDAERAAQLARLLFGPAKDDGDGNAHGATAVQRRGDCAQRPGDYVQDVAGVR